MIRLRRPADKIEEVVRSARQISPVASSRSPAGRDRWRRTVAADLEVTDLHAAAPAVSVLVVNWNADRMLARCAESVAAGLGWLAGEMIVYDNHSTDGSIDALPLVQGLRLVRRAMTGGFARATNEAAHLAHGRALVALNLATRCTPESLEGLVRHVDSHPDVAAVGPLIRKPDGRLRRSA